MMPTIDIIRHAQAAHNIHGSHLRDPTLTDDGVAECDHLREAYPFGPMVTNIVSSPLRRAIDTAILGILPTVHDHIKVKLLPELQEINPSPSSTGIPKSTLSYRYGRGHNVDMDDLEEDWYHKGFDTPYAPEVHKVEARARSARNYLRMLARRAIEAGQINAHIVVVTHGEFAHWLTRDFRGVSERRNSGWHNTECRSYRIENIFGLDVSDPVLAETTASIVQRNGPLFYWSINLLTMYSARELAARRVFEYGEMLRVRERVTSYRAAEESEQADDEYDERDISDESTGWVDVDDESD
ncbi:histidine phosphatase superfamily [Daldinia loculata]|nr:histidine phosphatase superfamily [Daldinia loculata]